MRRHRGAFLIAALCAVGGACSSTTTSGGDEAPTTTVPGSSSIPTPPIQSPPIQSPSIQSPSIPTQSIQSQSIPTPSIPTQSIPTPSIPTQPIQSPPIQSPPIQSSTSTAPAPTTTASALDCAAVTDGTHTITVAGHERTFEVVAPAGLGVAGRVTRAPVLVLFHGFASTAAEEIARTGLGAIAPDNGVVLVAAQGIGVPTGAPADWHLADQGSGDGEFTDTLLALVRSSACIDPSKVWLAGFSAGSAWTGVYGCLHADGIAGLLMHSGLPPAICPEGASPNIVIAHGTADPVVSFGGGPLPTSGGAAPVVLASVPDSAASWAAKAGCATQPTMQRVGPDATLTTWSGCPGARTVVFEAVNGLGHAWAGGSQSPDSFNPGCLVVQLMNAATDPVSACS